MFEYSQGPLGDVLITSRRRPELTFQGRPLSVRLRRPQDVISGRPRDGQTGSFWDVPGTLEGDVLGMFWGPIFAGWDMATTTFYSYWASRKKPKRKVEGGGRT